MYSFAFSKSCLVSHLVIYRTYLMRYVRSIPDSPVLSSSTSIAEQYHVRWHIGHILCYTISTLSSVSQPSANVLTPKCSTNFVQVSYLFTNIFLKDFDCLFTIPLNLSMSQIRSHKVALDKWYANKFSPHNSMAIYPKPGHALHNTIFEKYIT